MEINDVIKIKNRDGLMEIKLKEKLKLRDAGSCGIGAFEICRVEFHKTYCDEFLITLYDQREIPNREIYVITYNDDYPEIFKANISICEHEVAFYETIS